MRKVEKRTARSRDRAVRVLLRLLKLGLAADQHRDSIVTPKLRVNENAALDLGSRHSRLDQRVTNDHDATLVGAVESDSEGPILIHVVRDLLRLGAIGTHNLVTVGVERVVPVRFPVPSHRALGTDRTDRALWTSSAGSASWAGDATQLGAALGARRSSSALRACGTGAASWAGRADRGRALSTRASGYALRARGTGTSHRASRTREARALSARLPCRTLSACRAGRTDVAGTTDHHRACGARRSARALHTRGTDRTG